MTRTVAESARCSVSSRAGNKHAIRSENDSFPRTEPRSRRGKRPWPRMPPGGWPFACKQASHSGLVATSDFMSPRTAGPWTAILFRPIDSSIVKPTSMPITACWATLKCSQYSKHLDPFTQTGERDPGRRSGPCRGTYSYREHEQQHQINPRPPCRFSTAARPSP